MSDQEGPLWARPRAALARWAAIGASRFVNKVIKNGYKIKFASRPIPYYQHPIQIKTEDAAWAAQEIEENLKRGAWLELPERPDHCAAAFIVQNAAGKRRVVIDLRVVNSHIPAKPFKFESLALLRGALRRDDYLISCDLQAGYHHIAMHPESSVYLGFQLGGRFFRCLALPFGLNTAPRVFSKVMRAVVKYLRASGTNILPYLDDFLFWFRDAATAARAAAQIDALLAGLGLSRNLKKGEWTPTRALQHLGFQVDSATMLFRPTADRVGRVRNFAADLLSLAAARVRNVPATMLAKFLGLCAATKLAFPAANLYCAELYRCLRVAYSAGWKSRVKISSAAITELRFWREGLWSAGSSIDLPRPDLHLFSDASEFGWGAHLGQEDAHGYFSGQQAQASSTERELRALLAALKAFAARIAGSDIRVSLDSMSATWAVLRWRSSAPGCVGLLKEIYALLQAMRIRLWMQWVPRESNARADELSKRVDRNDYKLDPALFQLVTTRFGMPELDAFASAHNAQLPTFWAGAPQPGAAAVDALAQDWSGRFLWANPPWPLIPAVLRKAAASPGLRLLLVVPEWQSAHWWPLLLQLETDSISWRPRHGLFTPGWQLGQRAPPPRWGVRCALLSL